MVDTAAARPVATALRQPPVHPVRGRRAIRALSENQLEMVASTYRPGHDVTRVWLGPRRLAPQPYIAHSPRAAEQVFSAKSYGAFPKANRFYDEIRDALGDGLLTAMGEDWTRQKRFVQPLFTRARVDGYVDRMLDAIEDLAEDWRREPGTVDVGDGLVHLTLRVVADVLFGADSEEFAATIDEQFPALQQAMLQRVFLPPPVRMVRPLPFNRRFHAARRVLHETCGDLIERRRDDTGGEDLASLLMAARDGEEHLSDREVRDQVLVFLLAGHETTSTTLTFALHLLGGHPDVQEQVRAEVAEVVGDGRPTPAQLAHGLPYTTAVLKESMRLYPAAPFIGRRLVGDGGLVGYDVPAGSDVVVSVWNIHRREDLWPDPLRFDPRRFLGEAHRDRYAWMPFGAGPRACIGQHFSMLESVAALAVLVRALTFRAPDGVGDHVRVASGITLFPLQPVTSVVSPR